MKELIDSLVTRSKAEAANASTRLRFGPILEVNGRLATVRLAGSVVANVPCADHVDPRVDKQAWILQQGNLLVIVGVTSRRVPADTVYDDPRVRYDEL
jgi:hypothetical protein